MTQKKNASRLNREAKKAIVMNSHRRRPTAVIVITAIVAVAAAAALGWLLFPGGGAGPDNVASVPSSSRHVAGNGLITHAASLFEDGRARHFSFDDTASGTTIAYFILKSTDGVIRAAFDACDVCWPEGKGYVQEGSAMICRNCGRRFESVKINELQGGCNPAPLDRTIEGGQVVIRVEDLMQGRRYFNFPKKA